MQSLTSLLPSRIRVRALALRPALIVTLVFGGVSCSSDDNASTETVAEVAVVPDQTAIAPGDCDPSQSLAAPEISTGGTTTLATLGIGDFACGGRNGDGYISFNYNPVLIDGDGAIKVSVGDDVTATIAMTGGQPFIETGAGSWTSTLTERSCNRLTIELVSITIGDSAPSTATYGADIRVGGDATDCPQRIVDPADYNDPEATSPPPDTVDPTATTDTPLTDPATTN